MQKVNAEYALILMGLRRGTYICLYIYIYTYTQKGGFSEIIRSEMCIE